jgi:hypothetical protein
MINKTIFEVQKGLLQGHGEDLKALPARIKLLTEGNYKNINKP